MWRVMCRECAGKQEARGKRNVESSVKGNVESNVQGSMRGSKRQMKCRG